MVTGGGSGIGQASVLRILDEGGRVVAADISESGLKDTVAKAEPHGDRLSAVVIDVASEESVKEGVAEAVRVLGGLGGLVNAAGILRSAHFPDTTLADFEQVLRINLVGTFLMPGGHPHIALRQRPRRRRNARFVGRLFRRRNRGPHRRGNPHVDCPLVRVIQWTTPNIGRRSLHAIIGRDDMELVGVYAHGADKVGDLRQRRPPRHAENGRHGAVRLLRAGRPRHAAEGLDRAAVESRSPKVWLLYTNTE
jgi:hypothetical protein